MKCEICKKNDAQTAIHLDRGGVNEELYVCRACASSTRRAPPPVVVRASRSKPAGASARLSDVTFDAAIKFLNAQKTVHDHACPTCDSRFQDNGEGPNGGRLGCPDCYKVFANDLLRHYRQRHFVSQHVGKTPESPSAMPVPPAASTRTLIADGKEQPVVEVNIPYWDIALPAGDVVLGSRVSLSRNLAGEPFPNKAGPAARRRLFESIREALRRVSPSLNLYSLSELSTITRQKLCDMFLVSRNMLDRNPESSGIALTDTPGFCIKVNDTDHICIQYFAPGRHLRQAWEAVSALDSQLEKLLPYAWEPAFGYLTSDTSLTGSGLRAGVLAAIPGLTLGGLKTKSQAALRGLDIKMDGDVFSSNPVALARDAFSFSNGVAFGNDGAAIVERVIRIANGLVAQEANARQRLRHQNPALILNRVSRGLTTLQNAYLISESESIECLYALHLGVSLGLCDGIKMNEIDLLMLSVQRGHIQANAGGELGSGERQQYRADYLRGKTQHITLKKDLHA